MIDRVVEVALDEPQQVWDLDRHRPRLAREDAEAAREVDDVGHVREDVVAPLHARVGELLVEIDTIVPNWMIAAAMKRDLESHFRIIREKALAQQARVAVGVRVQWSQDKPCQVPARRKTDALL